MLFRANTILTGHKKGNRGREGKKRNKKGEERSRNEIKGRVEKCRKRKRRGCIEKEKERYRKLEEIRVRNEKI